MDTHNRYLRIIAVNWNETYYSYQLNIFKSAVSYERQKCDLSKASKSFTPSITVQEIINV